MAIVALKVYLPPVARLTRPARPLVPGNALLEIDLDYIRALDRLPTVSKTSEAHVPSRRASVRRPPPIVCRSSSSQSIHQGLV
jgi:hypothetical protein